MEAKVERAAAGPRVVSERLRTRYAKRWGIVEDIDVMSLQWLLDACVNRMVTAEYVTQFAVVKAINDCKMSVIINNIHSALWSTANEIGKNEALRSRPGDRKINFSGHFENGLYRITFVELITEMIRPPAVVWNDGVGGMPTRARLNADTGYWEDGNVRWHTWDPFDLPHIKVAMVKQSVHRRITRVQNLREELKEFRT